MSNNDFNPLAFAAGMDDAPVSARGPLDAEPEARTTTTSNPAATHTVTSAPAAPVLEEVQDPAEPAPEPAPEPAATVEETAATAAPAPLPEHATPTRAQQLLASLKAHLGIGQSGLYARRRLRAAAVLAAATLAVIWVTLNGVPGAAPSRAEQVAAGVTNAGISTRNETADAITALARNDQAAAKTWYHTHQTLHGIELTGKVRYAAAGAVLVASRELDGTCYMYGWSDGENQAPVIDASKQACTEKAVSEAQSELDVQAAQVADAVAATAADTFTAAAANVRSYGLTNWVDGQPSLQGLPADLGNGVVIVSNKGTFVIVQAPAGTGCVSAAIGADGTVGETTKCR